MKCQLSLSLAKGYLKTNVVSFAKTKAVSFCGAKKSEANSAKIGMIGCAMLLAACSTLPASAEPARSNSISGEVVRVWDGDTLHLQDGSGYRHKIRLNGRDINRQQVADGCAWHYRRYAREWQSEAEYAAYAEAEVQAKNQRLGLWRQASPQAPWQFRHRQQQQYRH